jgi:hypothetical protein
MLRDRENFRGGRMPMIGGEAAEATLAGRLSDDAQVEPYDLGWVADWLYGTASLPPMPLPPREPAHPQRGIPLPPEEARPRRHARRRARQLALL